MTQSILSSTVFFGLLLIILCAPAQAESLGGNSPSSKDHDPLNKDYIIGPEDVLKITVWDNEDLTRTIRISREGEFSFPLIGTIHADGLTILELEKEIARHLADGYLINPHVTILIEEYKSKKVFVLGEVGGSGKGKVEGPGTYPLTGRTTLLEIISRAGGPTPDASDQVLLIRSRNGQPKQSPTPLEEAREGEVITLDLRALEEGDIQQNIELQSGDTVIIPRAEFFFALGEVQKPGKYKLERDTTVLNAISIAGGLTEKAAPNRAKIIRDLEGAKREIRAKLSDKVQPHDVVVVPESFF
ncbi:MAG: polysaccharide biosynthesis/export family protein [Candidatus Tectomicrobia bacterium]|uniref:Polysaccharide biosynthesis/export family protein n=1 Tax=Tectimicrobiota bacterium TaxID=2528274 RepID=A0A932CPG7_UNCTE|nr:polysaccharide biosynthesis/export family protein [Candidatus Tectomicrobia bacterium]